MQIFHTSPEKIEKIDSFGMFGECLCFSADVYQMSACSTVTYSIEINEDEIIEAGSFFYQDDCEKLNDIVEDIMDLAGCGREEAEEFLSQRESHSDAEIDWRIQGYAGEAAKVLGYKCAEAEDEQGTVYLVPMLDRENQLTMI